MRSRLSAGAVAGLVGGILSGVLVQVMRVTLANGDRISMIGFTAGTVHATATWIGWLAYLVSAIVLGVGFGRLLADRPLEGGAAAVWGAFYGIAWWIVTGLVVIPALRGTVPLSSAAVATVRPAALQWLVAQIVYGVILGIGFGVARERFVARPASDVRPPTTRAA